MPTPHRQLKLCVEPVVNTDRHKTAFESQFIHLLYGYVSALAYLQTRFILKDRIVQIGTPHAIYATRNTRFT